MKTILVLAPHTDDGELGCGATLSKFIREKKIIYYVAFSSCEESLPEGSEKDSLKIELLKAMNVLGIEKENVEILNYPVRNFNQYRQQILEDMIKMEKRMNPDLILMPSCNDIHQDHYTIAREGLRAFKKKTILCYEVPWNNYSFQNQAFIKVEEEDVLKKIKAIQCYQSQSQRSYTSEDFIRSLLITHGVQIGTSYAEVFEVPRLIIE